MRYQAYPSNTKAPAFTVGSDDGLAVRDLIASLPPGQSARVKATLDVQMVPNLKTALVWGTLPGATDETIYIVAHRDGWFEASGDNAGGVAAMVGLAEYYSRIPQAQRRRTMVFIGLDGHHNTGPGSAVGGVWLNDPANKAKLFAKTALSINCEHPSTIQTYVRPRYHRRRCRALVEHVHGAAVVRGRTVAAGVDRHRGEGVQGNSACRSSPNRIRVRRPAISDACIDSRRESRPASSSTTSTPIVKRPRRYRGRVSRRRLAPTPRSSTK